MKMYVSLVIAALVLGACTPNQKNTAEIAAAGSGVVGGQEIEVGSPLAKSTVGIYESEIGYICSGTLLPNNLVLTAGHCVDPKAKNLKIYFTNKMQGADDAAKRNVIDSVVHANYSKEIKAENMADIAILKFEGDVPADYTPAQLLADGTQLYNGREIFVAGYGLNWTIGVSRGSGVLRATNLEIEEAQYSATETKLAQTFRKGICSGDSGGPAYLVQDGQLYVWGVASRGDSIPLPLVPKCMMYSIYTRVDAYQDWIQQAVNYLNQ